MNRALAITFAALCFAGTASAGTDDHDAVPTLKNQPKTNVVFEGNTVTLTFGPIDLPVHHDDGHPHFWPFTMWIFESPLSYWDPRHFGAWLGAFEIALAVALVVLLWRRFERPLPRAAIAAVAVADLSVPFLFAF